MSRYIDAEWVNHEYYKNPSYENLCHALNNAPIADVVEVVRCKDCRYFKDENTCEATMSQVTENDYCSFAERREDGEIC